MGVIEKILSERRTDEPSRIAAIEAELKVLEQNLTGWMKTLANPDLSSLIRNDIEQNYENARGRQEELRLKLEAEQSLDRQAKRILDPKQVLVRLRELDEVLAGFNPTLGNLELSRHIDRIDCFPDGRVVMRGTHLGLFDGSVEWLSRDPGTAAEKLENEQPKSGFPTVIQRQRTPLRVPNLTAGSKNLGGFSDSALDPHRFAGLDDTLLWNECWVIEREASWAKRHGAEVVKLRVQGWSMDKLARHFGKTPPTLRVAWEYGRKAEPDAILPRKAERARWYEDHAEEVMTLKKQGLSTKELAAHFKKSDTTVRSALDFAEGKVARNKRKDAASD